MGVSRHAPINGTAQRAQPTGDVWQQERSQDWSLFPRSRRSCLLKMPTDVVLSFLQVRKRLFFSLGKTGQNR
jgi:hypothetical protein